MRIGVIGGGVVGGATAQAFAGHVDEVRVYDSNPLRCTATLYETLDADIIFVCLPTPQKKDKLECDTQHVDKFFDDILYRRFGDKNFVLKSTVPIGYTRKIRERLNLPNLVHSPEFLTARTAAEDAANPTRLIIGYEAVEFKGMPCCAEMLYALYTTHWPKMRIYCMTSDESEAVKLMQNSFSAVKIACFNEFRSLADKLGMDWQRVLDALLAGGWINPMHTSVPGPDGKRGFGGSCLPKDLANLVQCMDDAGIVNEICRSADHRNKWVDRYKE